MPGLPDAQTVSPGVAKEFLRRTLPFSELPDETLDKLALEVSVDFLPKGAPLLVQGVSEVHWLYLVQKGWVRVYIKDEAGEESLVDFRGEGSSVGALALIRESRANMNVDTVEDSFFFRIPRAAFEKLLKQEPIVARYYLKRLSEDYVSKAYAEIRRQRAAPSAGGALSLFATKVADVVHREPATIEAGQSIQEAARIMARDAVGSLIVVRGRERCAGIVTDKDFRNKVVCEGLDVRARVETVMSSPVLAIDPHTSCFDALLLMMNRGIHHLAIRTPAGVVGMITSHDIMALQGRSPFSIFKEILAQDSIEGLYPLARKVPLVIRSLIEEGAKASNVNRMVTVLGDQVLGRLLTLLIKSLGPPPTPFCWLVLGSEGRREQALRTDQDNALLYRDCANPAQAGQAEAYFRALAEAAAEHLAHLGYPPCPGRNVAANPQWRMPLSSWQRAFDAWIARPQPKELIRASIFFDFRSVYGPFDLAEQLRAHLLRRTGQEDIFLRLLAGECLAAKPPLSFFKSFIVEKDGQHKNTLDIKARGLAPLVDFARLMALKHGIAETNTLARIELLAQSGCLDQSLARDVQDSYELLMQVRLAHQLRQIEEGQTPDNNVDPALLSDLEKRALKDAFSVIGAVQSFVRSAFRFTV